MLIHLHSQATTTPKVRAEIYVSDERLDLDGTVRHDRADGLEVAQTRQRA